jgi:hypothetical protein
MNRLGEPTELLLPQLFYQFPAIYGEDKALVVINLAQGTG